MYFLPLKLFFLKWFLKKVGDLGYDNVPLRYAVLQFLP